MVHDIREYVDFLREFVRIEVLILLLKNQDVFLDSSLILLIVAIYYKYVDAFFLFSL